MAITRNDFDQLIRLIEDGELDDYMIELRQAMDERNARRKDDILKLVKSVWGDRATVVTGSGTITNDIHIEIPAGEMADPRALARAIDREAIRDRVARGGRINYEPTDGPQIPQGQDDSMARNWPTPIEAQNGGGGGVGFSPVRDPMTEGGSGGSDPLGDSDPNIVSTGAQIG